jgi:hypothetical protein
MRMPVAAQRASIPVGLSACVGFSAVILWDVIRQFRVSTH